MATSENLIPIPGRLHSVATEGHVAGADEIYDDSLAMSQEQINALVLSGSINVILSASPSTVFLGAESLINLTAGSSTSADITITQGGNPIDTGGTGTGTRVTGSHTITPSADTAFSAAFVIGGLTKNASATVYAVNKIYYGIGTADSYAGITTYKEARRNPYTSYTFTPTAAKKYVYVLIPYEMGAIDLSKVKLGDLGYNMQLITDNATDVDGDNRYRVYRSVADNQAVTFTITINS